MARTCPFGTCDGSGVVVDEDTRRSSFCRCRDQLVAERRAKGLRAVIPRRYRDASFDRPPVTDMSPTAVAQVRRWVRRVDANLDEGRGLWLQGPTGTGKTTLAMLCSRAALDAGRTVAIYSVPRLLAEIRTTFDDGSARSYTELVERLVEVDLLHLDDVGAEKTSEWVLEQLYALVNARYEEQRAIILTTNLVDPDEMAAQITPRTVSRLEEMCDVVPVGGQDLRQRGFAGQAPERPADDDAPGPPPLWDVA